jgi:nicotinate-nucleotide pyrophosphorylase (carboxylating)
MTEPLVRAALLEDLGRAGDLTSEAVIPADMQAACEFVAREPGVIVGLDLARIAFRLIDPALRFEALVAEGDRIVPGLVIARVAGNARTLLAGERTALNFMCHLSGIATATASIADAIAHTKAKVCCTRKTIPGLRALQKWAVRAGGGSNHRFGLDDAVLIKDNHIAIYGDIAATIRQARANVGHMVKIEVEVDTLAQLERALTAKPDAVLLDNMGPDLLRQAVAMVDGRAICEASGRIAPATAVMIAESGVDLISVGWLTHSSKTLDIGLDHAAINT